MREIWNDFEIRIANLEILNSNFEISFRFMFF